MLRREFIRWMSLSLGMASAGCARDIEVQPLPGGGTPIIDAHCHVFNASDLPAARFLRQVVFEDFPEQAARVMAIRDPDIADHFYELFLRLLGANRAPTADQEIAYLKGVEKGMISAKSVSAARASAIEDAAQFLLEVDRRSRGTATMSASPRSKRRVEEGGRKFLDFIVGTNTRRLTSTLDAGTARAASTEAFTSRGAISRHLNWFALFRAYRHVLLEKLISDTRAQGFDPVMLNPALVDFDEWLYEDVASPLARQAEVMGLISATFAAKRGLPVVHGYIGVDPLREVVHRVKGGASSLETAREALTKHGFVGVKLYPPMGFRASGNRGPYPRRTVKALGFDPSAKLDEALLDLYQMCVDLDAPILAHAYASNQAGPKYAKRADPAYWLPIFRAFPELRVCLAHFGRFDARSAGTGKKPLPEASWEWTIGAFIKRHPERRIFVDISYFSEVLSAEDAKKAALAANFKRWIANFDPTVEHVVFGTDWVMLGRESGYERYVENIDAFLKSQCGLTDGERDRVFRRNAAAFLPLKVGSVGRGRLLKWYNRNGIGEGRLPWATTS